MIFYRILQKLLMKSDEIQIMRILIWVKVLALLNTQWSRQARTVSLIALSLCRYSVDSRGHVTDGMIISYRRSFLIGLFAI